MSIILMPVPMNRETSLSTGVYERMPGIKVTIEDMVAGGDKVICRNVWRWSDEGGTAMEFRGFVEWRFEGDKVAERWATVARLQPM